MSFLKANDPVEDQNSNVKTKLQENCVLCFYNFYNTGVKIVKNGNELLGKMRFMADGLASDTQCSTLKNMVQVCTSHAFEILVI
jgi:hypothetical protein